MAKPKTTSRDTYKYGGVVLRTRNNNEYLYATNNESWGPEFLSRRDLIGAEVFYSRQDIDHAKKIWGGPLDEVRVEGKITTTIRVIEATKKGDITCKQETSSSPT